MMLETLHNHMQKNDTRPSSYTIHINHSKWIKDYRPEIINFLEYNIGSILVNTGFSMYMMEFY